MPLQSGQNIAVYYKKQSGKGTPASGAGGTSLPFNDGSAGMSLTKQYSTNNQTRKDGQRLIQRHASRQTGGSYIENLGVGTQNDWLEAILRSTFTASSSVSETEMTSITTTTGTIVAAGGSWLTDANIVKGDLVKLTNHSTAANNGKWLRVVDVSATTITVPANSLTLDAAADTSFTLTVAKTLVSGDTPTESYWTIEQYFQDLDKSHTYTDTKVTKLELSIQPNGNILVTWTLMGLDRTSNDTGAAPVFTAVTDTAVSALVMTTGSIRIGGVDYDVLTGFTLTIDLGGSVPAVLSSTSPDVFLDNATVSGSFTVLMQDLVFDDAFDNETPVDFFIVCSENETDPADFISFYVGNATLTAPQGPIGNTGARTLTVPWAAGKDTAGDGHAPTMVKISTSI